MRQGEKDIVAFNLAAYLNDEVADRLVKASALVQALGRVEEAGISNRVLSEYAWALEAVIAEARQLQTRFWEEFTGAVE